MDPQLLEAAAQCSEDAARAYIAGATRDGTFSRSHRTLRISQADLGWLKLLQTLFTRLGRRSWIYREGASRSVWTIESSFPFHPVVPLRSIAMKRGFARGYFDAEGGIPRRDGARFYIQLCQKSHADLLALQAVLSDLGIRTGQLHNPSSRVDPEYWRFYVAARSHARFVSEVGSWHPAKRALLSKRFPPRAEPDHSGSATFSLPNESA